MVTRRKILNIFLIIFLVIFLFEFSYNLYQHNKENQYIYSKLNSKMDKNNSEINKLIRLTEMVSFFDGKNKGLVPISRIIKEGGDCSDKARVLISALRLEDIKSKRLALLNNSGRAIHAIVSIPIDGKEIISDPSFNIIFTNKTNYINKYEIMAGNYYLGNISYWYEDGLSDIRSDRWGDWKITQGIYNFINKTIGEKFARNLGRPYFMERFYLSRSVFFIFLSIFVGVVLILINRDFLKKKIIK